MRNTYKHIRMLTIPAFSSIIIENLPERNYPDTKKADDNEITLILFELLDFPFFLHLQANSDDIHFMNR